MPAKTKTPTPTHEDRIDEHAQDVFKHLGFTGRLPDGLVAVYKTFKGEIDKLSPGRRLTFEGFASVVTLWRMNQRG